MARNHLFPTYGGSACGHRLALNWQRRHGGPLHLLFSSLSASRPRPQGSTITEVPVSSYPLFEFPPVRSRPRLRHGRSGRVQRLDLPARPLRPFSLGSALLARQMLAARGRRLPSSPPSTHRHHVVGLDRSYLPITATQSGERGVTSISAYLKDKTLQDSTSPAH